MADWLEASFGSDIMHEVKRNGTAMYFSGIEWGLYSDSGLSIPESYLTSIVSAGVKVPSDGDVYGTNYITSNTFEDGSIGVWTGCHIVDGGYLSDHSLHSSLDSKTGLCCFSSIPILFGEGCNKKLPLNTWCDLKFKVRTKPDTKAGLGVLATVLSSKGNTYSFDLCVPDRAPLDGENWMEASMGFELSMIDGNRASFRIKRYDWCYLLRDDNIEWDPNEIPESVTLMVYAENVDLWLDDVVMSFEKENSTLLSSLDATPSIAAVGEEFTANYTIRNVGEHSVKNVPYNITYNPLTVAALTQTDGVVDLPPGTSKTISAVFKILEGGAAIITAGGAAGVKETSTRVSCTGRGYYFGDSHSHSTESDGKATPYDNLKQYYTLGMSFNISADHNVVPSETAVWDEALSRLQSEIPNPERFLHIKVTENSLNHNHAVQYFSPNKYDTPTTHEGWEEVIRKQKNDGGLTYIAHPFLKTDVQFWPILEGPSVILPQYKEANGFEIINSQTLDYTPETIPKALEWWDRYNITGWRRYFGIGNSDGHRLYELGGSYNCLLLDELTEENIKKAFANGNLFFTTGPQLRYTLGGVDMGGNVYISDSSEKVSLNVTAYTPNGTPLEKVVVYCYAIGSDIDVLYQAGRDSAKVLYERKYGEKDISLFRYSGEIEVNIGDFVRVEVYAARDPQMVIGNYQMAMSNPVWVVGCDTKNA